MSLRVITGTAKGRKLKSVPGDTTRPITDRAKSALFSILGGWVDGARVLDLFGGTGAVGIEALSRGAAFAHFLDLNRAAVETMHANLAHCRLEQRALVEKGDSFGFLQRYRGEPFDLIYVAPPQYQGLWHKALLLIDERPHLLAQGGVVVAQIHPREDVALDLGFLEEYDRRRYGSVEMIFYASAEELAADAEEEGKFEDEFDGLDDEFDDEVGDDFDEEPEDGVFDGPDRGQSDGALDERR